MTLADSLRGLTAHASSLTSELNRAWWGFGADNRTCLRAAAAEIRSEAAHLAALAAMFEAAANDMEEELTASIEAVKERK